MAALPTSRILPFVRLGAVLPSDGCTDGQWAQNLESTVQKTLCGPATPLPRDRACYISVRTPNDTKDGGFRFEKYQGVKVSEVVDLFVESLVMEFTHGSRDGPTHAAVEKKLWERGFKNNQATNDFATHLVEYAKAQESLACGENVSDLEKRAAVACRVHLLSKDREISSETYLNISRVSFDATIVEVAPAQPEPKPVRESEAVERLLVEKAKEKVRALEDRVAAAASVLCSAPMVHQPLPNLLTVGRDAPRATAKGIIEEVDVDCIEWLEENAKGGMVVKYVNKERKSVRDVDIGDKLVRVNSMDLKGKTLSECLEILAREKKLGQLNLEFESEIDESGDDGTQACS